MAGARNIEFKARNFQNLRKTRRKTSILKLQSLKIGKSLSRNARFSAPTYLVSSRWFCRDFAVFMGEAATEVSYEMIALVLPRILYGVVGFPAVSPYLWEH